MRNLKTFNAKMTVLDTDVRRYSWL